MKLFSRNTFIIFSSIFLAIHFSSKQAVANDLISNCFKFGQHLDFDREVCEGQFDNNFRKNVSKISHRQKSDALKFSISLRKLGYLEQSQSILNQLDSKDDDVTLASANLDRALYRRALSAFTTSDQTASRSLAVQVAPDKAKSALEAYYKLRSSGSEKSIISDLNWISLWAGLETAVPELNSIKHQNILKAISIIPSLEPKMNKLEPTKQADARLSLAESLIQASDLVPNFKRFALKNIDTALNLIPNDISSISRGLGLKGKIHILEHQPKKAIEVLEKAISAANAVNAPELAYQWQFELGQLYAATGFRSKAISKYDASITNLENIRNSSLSLKPELQYEFRDKVEPIYRNYLAFLFQTKNPNLEKIIRLNENLQIGELENYLQCGKLGLTSLLDLPLDNAPDGTLYIIKLPKQYAVILRLKDGSLHNEFIERSKFDLILARIRLVIKGENFSTISEDELKNQFFSLNNILISPIEKYLPKQGTIVLALDSNLQNIPWALLYDGNKYLIEKYSLAYTLGTRLSEPKSLKKIKGLVAGLSHSPANPEFSALPNVVEEVKAVSSILGNSKRLLDKSFTVKNLFDEGQGEPIIHLASHGQFSSDPENTFILGWNGKITLRNIEKLIRSRLGEPLELLILSACSTAEGDNRATLGIAGTAVQAGARSIVASLWTVNDESQGQLMQSFYKGLKAGKTKAEALRLAQLSLKNTPKFNNPYLYASLVLVGSWK